MSELVSMCIQLSSSSQPSMLKSFSKNFWKFYRKTPVTETYCDKFTGLSLFIQPTHFWLNYAAGKLTFTKKAQIRDNHFTIGTWTLFSQRTWKKSNLVSRNRSSERFLSLTRPHCGMYIRIYICLKKTHTHKTTKKQGTWKMKKI